MCHFFVGFTGFLAGPLIFGALLLARYVEKEHESYELNPKGEAGRFDPLLSKYIRASEFIIGIATGSIVLLVGSSALRIEGGSISGHGGQLPWFFASPLLLLAWSVIFGAAFIVVEILAYEEYQHGNKHTKMVYSFCEALGFTSLVCFGLGYMILIFLVTRP